MGSLSWLRTSDGRFRLSWRAASATAASPAQITRLDPIDMTKPERMWPMEPSVTCGDAGRFHMVFADFLPEHNHGLSYSTSDDGKKWSDPMILVENQPNRTTPTQPQAIVDGKRIALLSQDNGGCYVRTGMLADLPALSAPIQVGGSAASTVGTRWVRIGDDVVGLPGGQAPSVLRASVGDLFRNR